MNTNRVLLIIGGGESGVGAAILAKKNKIAAFVSDCGDIKPKYSDMLKAESIEFEGNTHQYALSLINSDCVVEVVKSPGIPDSADIIALLKSKKINIISEIEFAGRYTNATKVCITGSNGKTTTTMLIYKILDDAGYNVGLAGNVGKSFALQVATSNFDYYVIEISSFQLDNMHDFRAEIAIITNITPDHMDRYNYVFQNYVDSKFRILQNQTSDNFLIFCSDDNAIAQNLEKIDVKAKLLPFGLDYYGKKNIINNSFVENNKMKIKDLCNNESVFLEIDTDRISIKGKHNLYNSMAASLAGQVLNIKKESIRHSLETFEGVEHRMEFVANVRGVCYINDSKATNVNSCWYALQSIKTPVVLIVGGTDKGNDYSEIEQLVKDKVHTLVFLGVDNKKLVDFFAKNNIQYFEAKTMRQCVDICYQHAKHGDTVLLSPCCASFDIFKNYEDRGEQFKKHVKKL